MDPGTAGRVLNELGERVRSGVALLPGQLVTFEDWPRRVIPEDVPNPGEILFDANGLLRAAGGRAGAGAPV
ncbi:MAG: hypothetical protein ABWY62_07020, partial [Acidimicrobiia bacterium]